ncbi:GSCFA domain-containing protein [Sporomusa acidovorans]|uniref:GSCFA domain-containing protein n=1 Tax=Sporomusa acidovorans (strain ATCC 49682 / DSM 3132 / Mol) TaxID=1123286 RepID=A0ABZ3JAA7_SPOA4|nr:GSCFA domain-containing protein [Sporomusa acidovorans]OZC15151.1 GSCFA family protein [Sporomusa acidovorans DSM 3132]SDF43801.1 GSCFA family protein [Sporomusa acidovorans]
MKIFKGYEAYNNLLKGIENRTFRYPAKNETGYYQGMLLPKLTPKFRLKPNEKIFTIGSCFAREIEARLIQLGFDVPVGKFKVGQSEIAYAAPHLLNEYNAGTLLQRIESIFGKFVYNDSMGIEERKQGFVDLFLHIHNKPVTLARLLERRRQIDLVYQELLDCDTIIITLGLIETWYDSKHCCYLNKAPGKTAVNLEPDRYYFHRMDVDDVFGRLKDAICLINAHSMKKIILTVSPIPIEATFSNTNAIIANSFSKAVLRVVAQLLSESFDNVDYFPSYEIAISGGMIYFGEDNVHVTGEMVEQIVKHMLSNYFPTEDSVDAQAVIHEGYIDFEVYERLKI